MRARTEIGDLHTTLWYRKTRDRAVFFRSAYLHRGFTGAEAIILLTRGREQSVEIVPRSI